MPRQYIKRRILDVEILKNEIEFWKNECNNEKIGINWRFIAKDSRIKLKRFKGVNLVC